MAEVVHVRGLKEFQAALRQIDKALGPELRKGLNEVAEVVAAAARPLVPVRSGAAAASIKARSSQRGAALAVGGARVPYFGWLEWGGRTGRNKSTRRPFVPGGRTIYPSLRAKERETLDKLGDVIDRLSKQAGF